MDPYTFFPEVGRASLLEVFLSQPGLARGDVFREVTVSFSLGHSCCPASFSKICSKDLQHIRPSACEGEVPQGLWEDIPSHPPETAPGAAGGADRDPRAVHGAGPGQQLCFCSGKVVERVLER